MTYFKFFPNLLQVMYLEHLEALKSKTFGGLERWGMPLR